MEARVDAIWDDSRCNELEMFITLIREAQSIDNGSGCLARIAKVIELAKALDAWDFGGDRVCFRAFLHDLALADRFPDRHAKPG